MLPILNSGWILALAVAAFVFAYARMSVRAFRQGRMLQALANSLWAVGWLLVASLGFLGPAIEHSVRIRHYAHGLRLLAAMRVCGITGGCLTVAGVALTIYCASRTRADRRKDGALETCPVSGPGETWPPPPKRPESRRDRNPVAWETESHEHP